MLRITIALSLALAAVAACDSSLCIPCPEEK